MNLIHLASSRQHKALHTVTPFIPSQYMYNYSVIVEFRHYHYYFVQPVFGFTEFLQFSLVTIASCILELPSGITFLGMSFNEHLSVSSKLFF